MRGCPCGPPSLRAKRSNPSRSKEESWIASQSLSSGAHSRDPLARNDRFNIHNDDLLDMHPIPAARFARGLLFLPALFEKRAQGKPGARCTRGLACKKGRKAHTSIQVQRKQSGIPCAMVLTASFVISPAIGLFCHRRFANNSAKLDASVEASGPHDFSVRKQNALVRSAARVHRIQPRVRDDRDTPLEWGGRLRI